MTVDFSAFTQPVTSAQVKEFKKWARSSGTPGYNTTGMVVGGLVAAFIVFTVLNVIAGAVLTRADGTIIPSLLLFAFILGMAVLAFLVVLASTRRWESWYRLSSFAQHNGFLFSPKSDAPYYPGMIFTQGRSRQALDHVRAISGRYFDIGNFRYIVGSGKNQRTYNWGFMAFKLDRALPHMLLDATSNNGLFGSNLPTLFRKDQILSLEGDFNKYFTLYCPREYERDALYVFTPDLMALLIDEAAPFDVEIIDDWMFVYSSKTFSTAAPGNYERMFRVIETVGAKTLSQTDHYSDERVASFAANVVAAPGRRLRTRVSVFAIILLVLFVGLQLANFIGDILH
ncbi:MAG: hypothetical protein ACOH19_04255 [Rhodoglobus sp.]